MNFFKKSMCTSTLLCHFKKCKHVARLFRIGDDSKVTWLSSDGCRDLAAERGFTCKFALFWSSPSYFTAFETTLKTVVSLGVSQVWPDRPSLIPKKIKNMSSSAFRDLAMRFLSSKKVTAEQQFTIGMVHHLRACYIYIIIPASLIGTIASDLPK